MIVNGLIIALTINEEKIKYKRFYVEKFSSAFLNLTDKTKRILFC